MAFLNWLLRRKHPRIKGSIDESSYEHERLREKSKRVPMLQEVFSVAPNELDGCRNELLTSLQNLPVVRDDLLNQFWKRGPIDTISGVETTAQTVIKRVKEEAQIIRNNVANIESLNVLVHKSRSLGNVFRDGGPETHLEVKLGRHFRDGSLDVVMHFIVRTDEETFKFGCTPL